MPFLNIARTGGFHEPRGKIHSLVYPLYKIFFRKKCYFDILYKIFFRKKCYFDIEDIFLIIDMQVPYSIKQNSFGFGLYSNQYIPKGKMTWKAIPGENIDTMNEQECREFLKTRCSSAGKRLLQVSYCDMSLIVNGICIPSDASQYTNHSDNPNCGAHESCQGDVFKEDSWMNAPVASHVYALRDIQAGEELTEDYRSFHYPQWFLDLMQEYDMYPDYYQPKAFELPQYLMSENTLPAISIPNPVAECKESSTQTTT